MKLRKGTLRTAKSKAVRSGTKMTLAPKGFSFLSFIRGFRLQLTANYALLSFWNSPALFPFLSAFDLSIRVALLYALSTHTLAMPPIRTARNRKPPPAGFDDIEDTLLEFSNKMKDAENASHEGKKKHEVLWPIFQISHQRTLRLPGFALWLLRTNDGTIYLSLSGICC